MKMSLHTCGYTHHFMLDLCECIDYYADLGYQALDLSIDASVPGMTEYRMVNEDNWKPIAMRVKAKMQQRGLVFCQAHSPIVAYAPASEVDDKKLIRCIEICGYFGIKSLVVHMLHVHGCTPESFVKTNVEYYSKFLPYLDEYNVDICFENYGYWGEADCYCFSADELLKVINTMNHPHIHACWDTGHGNITRQLQYESVVKLGNHLRAVHVQDNLYPIKEPDGKFTPDMHMIPLFGNVNFDGFIQGLIDIGYKGGFSMESDIPNRRGHVDFIRNGSSQLLLKPIPFKLRKMADELQAETGKFMLQMYGLWEGKD